jgi:putative transposase
MATLHSAEYAFGYSALRGLPPTEWLSRVRREARERGIWQRRFWEHAIRDDADYAAHVDYVHFNPVKHGLVVTPAEWPYSTFRMCVQRGLYPLTWTGDGVDNFPAGEPGE